MLTGVGPTCNDLLVAGRRWREAATAQDVWSPPKPEGAGRSLPWSLWREHGPADASVPGFWLPRTGRNEFLLSAAPGSTQEAWWHWPVLGRLVSPCWGPPVLDCALTPC